MSILKCEKRDTSKPGKKLRRENIIPAVIYGKNLKESVSIQIAESDAALLLRSKSVGSTVDLKVGTKKYSVMLKEIKYVVLSNNIEHIDFQELTAGEEVRVSAHIHIVGREDLPQGSIIQELVSEIEYRTLPVNLVDHLDIDVSKFVIGDDFKVGDLDIAKDDKYNITASLDTIILLISEPRIAQEEPEEEEETEVV
ncbi:MAG: 50S ribosomal protein L25, partial [Vallitaleaceae bacterium]|nr:50S ribosomal protein L25 [Vallitaleaceae bacterium]